MEHRSGPPWMHCHGPHGHPWMYGPPGMHGQPWGPPPGPGTLASTLATMLGLVLLTGLIWMLLKWVIPNVLPTLAGIFSGPPAENPPALEILRQRYAAGEIDGDMFEQMRERLEASYQSDTWSGHRSTFYRPGAYK